MIHRPFESVRTRSAGIAQLGLAIAFASITSIASAQPTPGTDVLRTHDGTTTRGTILEYLDDGGVMMRTDAGDVRDFAEADIAFIGTGEAAAPPADEAPAPAVVPPAPAVDPARPVEVTLDYGDPRLRVHVVPAEPAVPAAPSVATEESMNRGSARPWTARPRRESHAPPPASSAPASPTPVRHGLSCSAPCRIVVPPWSYQLGLALEDRPIVWSVAAVEVRGPTALHASYRDLAARRRRGHRIGIPLTFVGGLVVVVSFPVFIGERLGTSECEDCGSVSDDPHVGRAMAISGMAGLIGGIVALSVAAASDDEAEFEPLTIRF